MKTHNKIELGILILSVLLSFILQLYVKTNLNEISAPNIDLAGESISKDYTIKDFSELTLSTQSNVIIRNGNPKVRITCDKAMLEYFEVENDNEQLSIDFSRIKNEYPSRVEIFTDKAISKISVYKTDNVSYEVTDSVEFLEIILKGASRFNGEIQASQLTLNAHDASNAIVGGKSDEIILGGRNAANINAKQIQAITGRLVAQDASNISLTATESIHAESFNASKVIVYGNPRVNKMTQRDASHIVFE